MRFTIRRTAVLAVALAALVTTVAACADPDDGEKGLPYPVHADVLLTGATNNRLLISGTSGFVVSSGDNKIERFQIATCGPTASSCQKTGELLLPVLSNPFDVLVAGGSLWVANLIDNTVVKANPVTLAIESTIDSSGVLKFNNPQGLAYSNGRLFVTNGDDFGFGPGYVSIVQGTSITAQRTTTQHSPVGIHDLGDGTFGVINGGACDFSTDPCTVTHPSGIDVINTSSGTIARNIPLGDTLAGPNLQTLAGFGYTGAQGGTLLKVDLATAVVQSLQLTDSPTGFITWVARDGNTLYALSFGEDRVYVVDAVSFTVTGFISVGPGGSTPRGPTHAVVYGSGATKRLFVLQSLANAMDSIEIP